MSGTDATSFSLVQDTLKNTEVFDFENKASYTITLTTTDNGGLTFQRDFTIRVVDTNEAPTAITLNADSLEEGSVIGTTIGVFNTSDPDTGDTHTYTLSGTDASSFYD